MKPDLLLAVFVIGMMVLFVAISLVKKSQPKTSTTMGSARWARERDLADMLFAQHGPPPAGAVPLCQWDARRKLYLTRSQALQHIVYLGPSGVGKTRTGIFHLLDHYQGSFITSDPKSEAWDTTSGKRKRPIRYAPRDPDESHCFNWIPACGNDPFLAMRLAWAIVHSTSDLRGADQFWLKAEATLLAALFAHASEFDDPTPASAYDFLTHPSHKGERLIRALLKSPNEQAQRFATLLSGTSPEIRGTVGLGAGLALVWLADPLVRRFTSAKTTSPDFSRLRREEISVYWCLAESDVSVLRPLTCLFFTLALGQLKEDGVVAASVVLDEVANIGQIPGLDKEITIMRGRGVSLVLGLQSLSQLYGMYGQDGGKTIWDNLLTKVVMHSLSNETAEQVSRVLGDETITEERRSRSSRGETFFSGHTSTTKSESKHARRLMTADEIRRLGNDEFLIITANRPPIRSKRQWYDATPERASAPRLGNARSSWPISATDTDETDESAAVEALPFHVPLPPPMPRFDD